MNLLEKISEFFGKFMAVIVLVVAALSLFVPASGLWIQLKWVNYLLMLVMFGMGLTLKLEDFKLVFTRPKDIICGCLAQFIIMPALAFVLSKVFKLDAALMAGVILVGTCPGGTSSNVITYLSKGDVALSVGMTSVNTLLAPLLTPAITYLLLRTTVNVDILAMFLSIVKVVIIPIGLGFVINKFFGKITQKIVKVLPMISVISICMIVASVVSHNAAKILGTGAIVFVVVILHNLLGYACGFGLGKVLKLTPEKTKALSVEIGMQNSGLATSLAATSFQGLAMATVPGAIFSVWHNISGAILANIYNHWAVKKDESNIQSSELIIRDANVEDLAGIMKVEEKGFIQQIQEDVEVFKKRIEVCPHMFLVFENPETKEIAGYLSAEYVEKIPQNADEIKLGHVPQQFDLNNTIYSVPFVFKLYITSFSLLPQYRGNGLGKLMWNKSLDYLAELNKNFDEVVLLVNENWTAAKHIYEQCGFEAVNTFNDFFPDEKGSYSKGILMTKQK